MMTSVEGTAKLQFPSGGWGQSKMIRRREPRNGREYGRNSIRPGRAGLPNGPDQRYENEIGNQQD